MEGNRITVHMWWGMILAMYTGPLGITGLDVVLELNQTYVSLYENVALTLFVFPQNNTECTLKYQYGQIALSIDVGKNPDAFPFRLTYNYTRTGSDLITARCTNLLSYVSTKERLFVEEPVTGLQISSPESPTILGKKGSDVVGAVRFNFSQGSDLKTLCEIDESDICGSTLAIENGTNTGCVTFLPSYFGALGYYSINITLFNNVSYGSVNTTVYYYVNEMENLTVHVPDFVLINTSIAINSTVDSGSSIDYEWSLAGFWHDTVWLMCYDNHSSSSFTHFIRTLGRTDVEIVASNALGSISAVRTFVVLVEVSDFVINLTSDRSDANILLYSTSPYINYMGNLSIEVLNGTNTLTNTTLDSSNLSEPYILHSGLPQGDISLTVTITSPVSEQTIYVNASIWDPINVSLYADTGLVVVGEEFTVEIVNTTGWGQRYEVDFGDNSYFYHSDIGMFRSTNLLISHVYNDSGVFDMVVNISNGRFDQTLHKEFSAFHPVPSFGISCIPLITIPPGSLMMHITLDDLFAENPTNASCLIFRQPFGEAIDCSKNECLDITWADVTSGAFPMEFTVPQTYQLSLNCSNPVSTAERSCLVEVQRFTADDFIIDYPRAVGFGSADTQAEVVYTIHLFQDTYIPPNVQFTWTYDDGNTVGPVNFTFWTNNHFFQKRGIYNSSVTIEVLNSSIAIRQLPVTVGVLTVEANITQGVVNVDGLGLLIVGGPYGSRVTLDIYFGDGTVETCTVMDLHQTFYLATSKLYNAPGVFSPRIIISSELFEERNLVRDVAMFWPISAVNLILQEVIYPPGKSFVDLTLAEDSPSPTNVTCVIKYSDGSASDIVNTLPATIQHIYTDTGVVTVTAQCSNAVSSKNVSNTTTVSNSCFGPGSPFRGQKQVTKLFSERLTLTAAIDVLCKNLTSEFFWKIIKAGIPVDIAQSKSTVLYIAPRQLPPGKYTVSFHTSFREHPELIFTDEITVNILVSPLVVRVKGGTSKSAGTTQSTIVDVAGLSFDPDVIPGNPQGLTFSWTCHKAGDLNSAENLAESGVLAACPACLAMDEPGKVVAPPGCLEADRWHVLRVGATKDVRRGSASQILHLISGRPPLLELRCKVNCLRKKNTEFSITLESKCEDCSLEDLETIEYQWTLHRRAHLQDSVEEVTELRSLTSTGVNISSISIKPYSLAHDYIYRLQLHVSGMKNKSPGTVSEFFTMNLPPYRGSCQITPQTGLAVLDKFHISCPFWVDEGTNTSRSEHDTGHRLTYQYVLVSDNETSLLYFGDFVKSPPFVLGVGAEDANYVVEIKARIFDPYNGMAEIKLFAQVTPPIAKDSGQKNLSAVFTFLEDVNTDITQSVKEGDIQKTSRLTESVSSVVNTLALPLDNSTLPEDPEPWLRAQPLDVPQGNKSAVPWGVLWDDLLTPKDTALQDKLTKEMEAYVDAMRNAVNKAMYLSTETLFYLTSSMVSVVRQKDLISENGLEMAVEAVNQTIHPLDSLVAEELSDTRVDEVLSSLLSSVDKMVRVALPAVPVMPTDVDIQTARKEMSLKDTYRPLDNTKAGTEAKEKADIHDNERAFFLMRTYQEQQYEAKRKENLARTVTGPLQEAIDKALKAASRFLVIGQKSKVYKDSIISAAAEKFRLKSFFGRVKERGDIRLRMDIKDSFPMENPTFDFKTTVFQENPFVWNGDGDSSRVSSPALVMDFSGQDSDVSSLDNFTGVKVKQTVSIPNPNSITSTTVTPRFIPLDHDQLLYHRLELTSVHDAIILFLTSSIRHVKYDVYFRSGEFPTSSEYDYKTGIPPTSTLDGNTKLKVMCPERSLPHAGTVYIGLRPYNLEGHSHHKRDTVSSNNSTSSNDSTITSDYGFGVGTVGCRSWEGDTWSTDTCWVSVDSSETSTVCVCEKPLTQSFTLATSFVVPVNKIDFSTVFTKIDLLNNGAVFATIISLLVVYALLAVWARHKDCGDFLKWGITPLIDNDPRDHYVYIVTVSTGIRPGAGTKSRVGVVIAGEHEDSGIRVLYDGIREELPRQSVVNYLMTVPYPLGELMYIRVWHDDSGGGDKASWFLHNIVVEDIQDDKRYTFSCGQWLAVDEEDGQIERTLAVSGTDDLLSFGNLFNNNIRTSITDSHLWLSVVMRPKQSHFTRLQRLSCCLSLLFLTMIASAMFYRAEENVVRPAIVSVGSFRFSLPQIYISFISILIVTPVNLGIVLLFKKSKPHNTSTVSPVDRLLTKLYPLRFRQRTNLAEFMIAQRTYSPNEKMLPHWCVYFAWGLIFLSVTVPAFFLFLYSQEWGSTKSDEWLTAFILAFFESLFILDPIKVVLLTAILAMIFRKPEDENIAIPDKEEIANTRANERHNDTVSKDYTKSSSVPLTEEALKRAQTVRREETTAFGLMREVTFYTTFLIVIFTIAYVNRDNRSFALRQNIHNMMVKRQMDKRIGLENVRSREDFFQWMNDTAFQALFAENYYEGTRRHWRERHITNDLQNYRVGPPRLRQVRSPTVEVCYVHHMGQFSCQKRYDFFDEDTNDYCVGWKNKPCPDREPIETFTAKAWTFTSSLKIWGMPIWGHFNVYSGGGYINEMGVNYQVSSAMLMEEFYNLWLDRRTRAVSLEFTLYNPNVNMFCYVTLIAEFPETGGALTSALVQPFRAYHHEGPIGAYVLFNEITFLVCLLGGTLKLLLSICKQKAQFFRSFWNVTDLVTVCTCYVSVVMFVGRHLMVKAAIETFNEDKERFVNFQHITVWDDLLVSIMGLICFLCTLRMIKILGYNRRINSITSVLKRASDDLLGFSVLFFIVFWGFVMVGYLLFGRSLKAYGTILTTVATLITSIIGKTPFDDMRRTEPVLAQVFFSCFVFFIVFVLLTMFLCILNESINAVRAEDLADADRHRVLNLLIAKFKESIGLLKTPVKMTSVSKYKMVPTTVRSANTQDV